MSLQIIKLPKYLWKNKILWGFLESFEESCDALRCSSYKIYSIWPKEGGGHWQELWGMTTSKLSSPIACCPSSSLVSLPIILFAPFPISYIPFISLSPHPLMLLSICRWWWCGDGGRCLETAEKDHLQLTFGREGGGGGEGHVEIAKIDHLWLAFGHEGGGGGGTGSWIDKKTTSSSHLDAREVVVVAQVVE